MQLTQANRGLASLEQRLQTTNTTRLSPAPQRESNALVWVDTAFKRLQKSFNFNVDEHGLLSRREEWLKAFANDDITLEEADEAVTMCVNKLEFVPSVSKFREMICTVKRAQNDEKTQEYLQSSKNFKRSSLEVAEKQIAHLKKILKKSRC